MARTPIGYFRRNKFMRYGYGALINYRLASVTKGVPNANGTGGASAPLSGEAQLDVTHTMPTADGNPVIAGRGSWPAPAAGGMSDLRPEGGIAVSYTAAVGGIGPGLYPRTGNAGTAINATVDISVDNGDGTQDVSAFGGTVDHRYAAAGVYTPKLVITDQLNRVSTKEVATGAITVTADAAAPSFSAGPTAVDGGSQEIDTGFTVDDNGTVYVVVVANGDAAPSAAEVKAGTGDGGAVAEAADSVAVDATVAGTLTLTPTSGAGTYDVYFVANDGTNDQAGAPTAVTGVVVA